jgi:hypothetical protein
MNPFSDLVNKEYKPFSVCTHAPKNKPFSLVTRQKKPENKPETPVLMIKTGSEANPKWENDKKIKFSPKN